MAIKDALLPEYDHELATARRLLERVPEGDLTWKPHDKSMSLGQLAAHIANLPYWCSVTIGTQVLDLATLGDGARLRDPQSVAEILTNFDKNLSESRRALEACGDGEMMAPWTLKNGGHEIFTMPRVSALRSFVMNHLVHHRGQLSVYLRLRNVPIPPIYGPTADEA